MFFINCLPDNQTYASLFVIWSAFDFQKFLMLGGNKLVKKKREKEKRAESECQMW